jgi:hypothetical protein
MKGSKFVQNMKLFSYKKSKKGYSKIVIEMVESEILKTNARGMRKKNEIVCQLY